MVDKISGNERLLTSGADVNADMARCVAGCRFESHLRAHLMLCEFSPTYLAWLSSQHRLVSRTCPKLIYKGAI